MVSSEQIIAERLYIEQSFELLGVPFGIEFSEVQKAYRRLIKQYHPDALVRKDIDRFYAEMQCKVINVAYARLKRYYKQQLRPFAVESKCKTVFDDCLRQAAKRTSGELERIARRVRQERAEELTGVNRKRWVRILDHNAPYMLMSLFCLGAVVSLGAL